MIIPATQQKTTSTTQRGLIFSDVDGTFWDNSYHHPFSQEFLADVFSRYDVVFSSSRTVEEMLLFQRSICYRAPFIAENGGVVVFYDEAVKPPPHSFPATILGERVLLVPRGLRSIDIFPFVQFATITTGIYAENIQKMSLETIAAIGGYGIEEAQHARVRRFSMALSMKELSASTQQSLQESLEHFQCSIASGGKWMIITRESDKGEAVRWYEQWLRQNNVSYLIVAAIGNENNDIPMLRAVNMPFVVRNQYGYVPALSDIPRAHLLQSEGTLGWGEMISVLDSLLSSLPQSSSSSSTVNL